MTDLPVSSDEKPGTAAAAALRHGRARIFYSIGGLFLVFLICGIGLSFYTGAPFTVPTERISAALGISYAIPFLIGITGYALTQVIAWYRNPQIIPLPERLQNILADCYFLILFVLVVYVHFQIKAWMPLINPVMYDDVYMAIDRQFQWLLDGMRAVRNALAAAPQMDYLYQLGFQSMFAVSLWAHALGDRRWHFHNMYAILLLQMIGPFTYLIAPAVGPFVFEHGPNIAATEAQIKMLSAFQLVQAQGVEWLAVNGGDYFTGPPAAMPSLHIAGALIIIWYMLQTRSVLLPFVLFMAAWISIESVVSRWHYLIDLPPGIVLAVFCIYVTNRVCRPVTDIPAEQPATP